MQRKMQVGVLSAGLSLSLLVIVGLDLGTVVEPRHRAALEGQANRQLDLSYGELPLAFEANKGQTSSEVRFLSRGEGYALFLTRHAEEVLVVSGAARKPATMSLSDLRREESQPANQEVLRLGLIGSRPDAQAETLEPLAGKANYFIGSDPHKWLTNVPLFGRVRMKGVYSGIDIAYYGNQGRLEQDFIVAPGAKPAAIAMVADGAQRLSLNDNGDLVMGMKAGDILLHKPVAYQEVDGERREVASRFVLTGQSSFGFAVTPYDETKQLIIDPVLGYSSYLGGSATEAATGIAVDSAGNAYVTGQTTSTTFPTTSGAAQSFLGGGIDVFVTKINPSGTGLIYSTYIGGSLNDTGFGIALDSSGNAYITGRTQSINFPVTAGAFQTVLAGITNAFVTKLNSTGSALVYSTYLGGSADQDVFNTPLQSGYAIAVDSNGHAYVTGYTDATDFPTTPGAFQTTYNNAFSGSADVFVTKLTIPGTGLVYSTYLGIGTGTGIALDSSRNAYITGAGMSIPTTPGAFQTTYISAYSNTFVTKMNPTGTGLVYSTYLGGNGQGSAIALDSSGNAYVTGIILNTLPTTSGAFQTTNAGNQAGFVTKFNSTGSALVYSTYLNGTVVNSDSQGTGIALDSAGNAYVTGLTNSTNFPVTATAVQSTLGGTLGADDAFVTELNATGTAPVYSSYLGGSSTDAAAAIALDPSFNIYVAGNTNSTDYPTTAGAFQTTLPGTSNAFVTKVSTQPVSTTTTLTTSGSPVFTGQPVTFTANVTWSGGTAPNGDQVAFKDATTLPAIVLGTVPLSGGKASFTTSSLSSGAHIIKALYLGDPGFNPSVSSTLTETVLRNATTTAISSNLNPSVVYQTVNFTAVVTGQSPTGTVTFNKNGVALATVPLIGAQASYSYTFGGTGTKSITATYSGDLTNNVSTSPALSQVIASASTITNLSSSLNPSAVGQAVTFTATVSGQFGGTPSGTVTFMNGTVSLGTFTLSGGKASVVKVFPAAGSKSISAVYSGDVNFTSSSASLTQTVN